MIPSEELDGGGKFRVENMFFPAIPEQSKPKDISGEKYVAFVSGIGLSGSTGTGCLGALELASSWLTGEAGEVEDQENNAKIKASGSWKQPCR